MVDRRYQEKSLEDSFDFEEQKEKKSKKDKKQTVDEFPENDPSEHHNPDDPREKNRDRVAEKVHEIELNKEDGYLYFIDKDGDVARVPSKWNKDPRFLEKVKEDAPAVERKLEQMQNHYPAKEEVHHDPIPKEDPKIPAFFQDKEIFYVDKAVIGTINDSSITKGHAKIYSLDENPSNDEYVHNLTIASFTASILFEGLKAQGTNIITNLENGRMVTSVIPRFENDGLNLLWEMKQGDQNKVKAAAEKIKAAFVIGEKKDFTKVNLDNNKPKKVNIIDKEQLEKDEKEINYMEEHLSERWA